MSPHDAKGDIAAEAKPLAPSALASTNPGRNIKSAATAIAGNACPQFINAPARPKIPTRV